MPPLALFASKNMKYESIVHLSDKRRKAEQYMSAQKIQIDVNYEVFLDMSPEMIDLWLIHSHFKKKWSSKYKVKEHIPCDVIERKLSIDDFTLIWNLSNSRIVSFKFRDLRSINDYFVVDNNKYVSIDGQKKFVVKSQEA